jgi:hypothetical protein
MSRDAVKAHRAALDRSRERGGRIGALAAVIHAEWWRPLRNRQRRREIRRLLADGDLDHHVALAAWGEMSLSERAAENERALRGAAVGR